MSFRWRGVFWFCLLLPAAGEASPQARPVIELRTLTLAELANLEVTTVSRTAEPFSGAAASIYVITGDEIRRSGVQTLPEALRLAPNLQVARIASVQYAIGARGFNNVVSNKLLVLVDGRTIYTPLFSGVFWEQQEIMLEDVDRIEVISGPGATLWGANAVNGVINVITRSASDAQGLLVSAGGGNRDQTAAVRYGSFIGPVAFRVYGKAGLFGDVPRLTGASLLNDWRRVQVGFRADWADLNDQITVQGDGYEGGSKDRGSVGTIALGSVEDTGVNLLARWKRQFADGSHIQVQAYWDRSRRRDVVLFQPDGRIYDLEFEHGIPAANHRLLWGGGYRNGRDEVTPGFLTAFVPERATLNWANLYVQDEIFLSETVDATLGVKFEHNDYTGVEYLPSARIAWRPVESRLVWASVSRAVRAPSRYDRAAHAPGAPPYRVVGGPNFESEVAKVVEIGYRSGQGASRLYSITAFYQAWDNLRSASGGPRVEHENKIRGNSYGIEGWAKYQLRSWWRLDGGVTLFHKNLELEPNSGDAVGVDSPILSNDPNYQWTLRSAFDIGTSQEADVMARRVGELPNPNIPAYTAVDLRYGWRFRNNMELSLTIQNALDRFHSEGAAGQNLTSIERAAYLKLVVGM